MYVYRCVLTTIDPETAVKDPEQEPLRTLRKYVLTLFLVSFRCLFVSPILSFSSFFPIVSPSLFSPQCRYRLAEDPVLRKAIGESPLMGINLSLDQPGKIRVGDVVYAGQL